MTYHAGTAFPLAGGGVLDREVLRIVALLDARGALLQIRLQPPLVLVQNLLGGRRRLLATVEGGWLTRSSGTTNKGTSRARSRTSPRPCALEEEAAALMKDTLAGNLRSGLAGPIS